MGKVISVANMNGGVGKTTASIALAEATTYTGKGRALVIDLDPQINASYTLSGGTPINRVPWRNSSTIIDYLAACASTAPGNANGFVQHAHSLNGPSVSYLSGSSEVLIYERRRLVGPGNTIAATQSWFLSQIDRLLGELRPNYQLIIFDCPPGLSLLAEAALTRSDRIIIPVSPTRLATLGLAAYERYLTEGVGIPNLHERSAILKTMVTSDNQGTMWCELIDNLRDRLYVFDNKWLDRAAFVAAMDREGGHRPFRQAYGNQADVIEATAHELWERVLSTGAQ